MFYCSKNKLFFKYCSLLYSIYAPPLSNASFSTKPLLLTSTVCSDWPTGTVQCDWPNTTSHVRNVTPLSIIASFSFQNTFTFMHLTQCSTTEPQEHNKCIVNNVLNFTISSSPRQEQSRVTDTVMKLLCVCTQAMVV